MDEANHIKAEADYGRGMKYKDIALKYDVTINTVKSWKNRYSWSRERVHTKEKGVHTKTDKKKGAPSARNKTPPQLLEEDVELTERQRLFCLYYIKNFNATHAAIKAGYAADSAHVEGSRLLSNAKVAGEIRRLKSDMHQGIFIDAMDVLNKYIKIAFTDITDFLVFGRKDIVVGFDDDMKPIIQERNYVDFNNSDQIDGSLISEVKQGKEGVSIKLIDKMKALEKLELYFDLFPDKFKRKIEEERLKLDQAKAGDDAEDEQVEDDGFLAALSDQVSEVWGNGDTSEDQEGGI